MGRFEGTVMAVTGAAQGIGRRVAERAAAEGAKVAVIDRSALGAEVAREIGNGASFIEADLETWDGAALAMARVAETFGRIDALVNNVGGAIWMKPFAEFAPHEIEREMGLSGIPCAGGHSGNEGDPACHDANHP